MFKIFTLKKFALTNAVLALVLALQTFSPLAANPAANRPAEANKIHAVLLVDGNAGGIGNADMQDVASMRRTLEVAFANDRSRLVIHDLTGVNPKTGTYYTGPEVLAYLRGMQIGQNDNVVAFHSGHGSIQDRTRPEATQYLSIDGGGLLREDIRSTLQAKKPRALIILTDCCSSFVGGLEEEFAGPCVEEAPGINVATVRNLLLKTAGYVSITAAEDGRTAVASFQGANPGQAGSAFTVALMRLWYTQDVTYTSWEQMFPVLRSETLQASGGRHQARAFQIREQATVTTQLPGSTDDVRNARK